ncbi:hypothetical protein CDG60_13710 [Acinetobacter chinensis]|uniref:DUF2845 domain-containing protein n=1 Tax=Acinetobacter chinensis TaxID=2004650 RepID=A0A3B7LYS0_9GAMM|nr:hypothetical protein [Acinetobacter chinensis]AXY57521.1 hypothetical protein CDG60_13710 [Acinetobacter chinensis]WOE40878.1 hypothetical protein QSG87_13495 [Acinetobacter chinensis]
MKYILSLALSLCVSTAVFAATESSSVRTPTGQLVSVGDTLTEMEERMGQSPESMNTYELKEKDHSHIASAYVYEIDNSIYTLTVVNNQVKKIERINKTP